LLSYACVNDHIVIHIAKAEQRTHLWRPCPPYFTLARDRDRSSTASDGVPSLLRDVVRTRSQVAFPALTVVTGSPARHRRVLTALEWQRDRNVTRLGAVVQNIQHGASAKPATFAFPSAVAVPAMVEPGRLQGCVGFALHDLPSISGAMAVRKVRSPETGHICRNSTVGDQEFIR
jgi:hypothetical protein